MAWEDQVECSFRAQFVIRGEPGRHIEDKAAGIVIAEAAGDVGAVRGDDRLPLGRVHEDRLQPRGVARGEKEFDPGQDDLIPADQLKAVGSLHIFDNAICQRVRNAPEREPFRDGVLDPKIEFLFLDVEFCLGKGLREHFHSAYMIEMNMGDDDVFYVTTVYPDAGKGVDGIDVAFEFPLGIIRSRLVAYQMHKAVLSTARGNNYGRSFYPTPGSRRPWLRCS